MPPEEKEVTEKMDIGMLFLLTGAAILTGLAGILINQRTQIPDSLFLIVFGLLIGPVLGLVSGEAVNEFLPIVSTAAMVVILLDSGISFDISKILGLLRTSLIFTLSVAVLTTILITLFLVYFFGWDIGAAALLGLIASGTTTITAMALIKDLKVDTKVKRLILLETIINDLTLILGAFIIIDIIRFSTLEISSAVSSIFSDIGIGLVLGAVFAIVWRKLLPKADITRELNYASTLGICLILYFVAEALGGNSIIAIFAFSLMLGNYRKFSTILGTSKKSESKKFENIMDSIESSQINFTFFMKAFFFVLLGATFSTSLLSSISIYMILGIIVLILIARLVSISGLSYFDKDFAPYKFLVTVLIPRGYVAAVLAFIPVQYGIEIPMFTDIVVILVVLTSIVAMIGVFAYASIYNKRK